MSDTPKQGVLYVVNNPNFVKQALISAQSVKKHNPNLHITFFADENIDSPYVDSFALTNRYGWNDRRTKIDNIMHFPYERTLFLDSDTIIDYRLDDMFELLDTFDLAMVHDLARKRKYVSDIIPEYGNIPYSFSELNTGVMAIKKNEKTDFMFEMWKDLYYKYRDKMEWDQPTFRVSLWEAIRQKDLKLYVLPPEYNIRSKANREKQKVWHEKFGEEHLTPRIYHMHVVPQIKQGASINYTLEEALEFSKKNMMEY